MIEKPYTILKYAKSSDGFIGQHNKSIWLTNEFSKRLVHKWRSEVDAILAGTGTVLTDNPKLTTRYGFNKNPSRVILNRQLNIGVGSNIFNNEAKTIIFTTKANRISSKDKTTKYIVPNIWELEEMLSILYSEGIRSIIIEGGQKILNSFVEKKMWEEARVFTSSKELETGLKAPNLNSKPLSEFRILTDRLQIFKNFKVIKM